MLFQKRFFTTGNKLHSPSYPHRMAIAKNFTAQFHQKFVLFFQKSIYYHRGL